MEFTILYSVSMWNIVYISLLRLIAKCLDLNISHLETQSVISEFDISVAKASIFCILEESYYISSNHEGYLNSDQSARTFQLSDDP